MSSKKRVSPEEVMAYLPQFTDEETEAAARKLDARIAAAEGRRTAGGLSATIMKKMSAMGLSLDGESKFEYLPTGFIALDYMFYGGLVKGTITTLRGFPSFGKSTLNGLIALNVVRSGGSATLIDTEMTMTREWLRGLGDVDDQITLLKPDRGMPGEAILDATLELVANGKQDFIGYDSIKDTVFAAEIEGSMSDNQVGLASRQWGKFCRKVKLPLMRSGTVLFMTNKDRNVFDKYAPDIDYGGSEIGGFAPVARASMLSPKKPEEGSGKPLVLRPKMVKYKNKASNRRCELSLFPDGKGGFIYDFVPDLLEIGKNIGVFTFEDGSLIKGNGVWFFRDMRLASGGEKVGNMLYSDESLRNAVHSAVYEKMYVTPSESVTNDNEFDGDAGDSPHDMD